MNSGTVTKSKIQIPNAASKDMVKVIETAGLKECSTPPNDRRTSVVRAFNFEGMPCPSPAGKCLGTIEIKHREVTLQVMIPLGMETMCWLTSQCVEQCNGDLDKN